MGVSVVAQDERAISSSSEEKEAPSRLLPISAPVYTPVLFSVAGSANEVHVILAEPRPLMPLPDHAGATRFDPVAAIRLSPHAAKDLVLLLQDAVERFENEYGPITTEYSKGRAADPKQ